MFASSSGSNDISIEVSFDPGLTFNINMSFHTCIFKSNMKIAIHKPTAPAIKKIAFNFVKSNILSSIPAPLPMIDTIDYIVSNHEYIKKKKGHLLMHPKKIAKSLPGIAIQNVVNSDYVHDHVVDQLHGISHNVVDSGIKAFDFYHMFH